MFQKVRVCRIYDCYAAGRSAGARQLLQSRTLAASLAGRHWAGSGSAQFNAIGVNNDLAVLVQRTDGFLEVTLADAKHTADHRRVALVADRQAAIVVAQLGENLRVQAGGGFFAYRLQAQACLLYTSPSPRDRQKSRMPSSA